MTLAEKINRIPPYIVRVLAKCDGDAMNNNQISKRSGLSLDKVKRISYMRSWSGVSIIDASKFCDACGVDILRQRDASLYIRNKKFVHVRNCKNPQLKKFLIKLMNYEPRKT
jgi:hypothetical protein